MVLARLATSELRSTHLWCVWDKQGVNKSRDRDPLLVTVKQARYEVGILLAGGKRLKMVTAIRT